MPRRGLFKKLLVFQKSCVYFSLANRTNSFSTTAQFAPDGGVNKNCGGGTVITGLEREPITVPPRLANSAVISAPPPGTYSVKPVPMPGMGMAAKLGSISDNKFKYVSRPLRFFKTLCDFSLNFFNRSAAL